MYNDKTQAGLYAGGWSRGANTKGVAVIDLTGERSIDQGNVFEALNSSAEAAFGSVIELNQSESELPWLSFKVRDFGIPNVKPGTWQLLADTVRQFMKDGISVLVCCQGGHGRTGMVISILCYLMNNLIGDPVKYVRSVYCNSAVETYAQHEYVCQALGLPKPDDIGYKCEYKVANYVTPYTKKDDKPGPDEKWWSKFKADADTYGIDYSGTNLNCIVSVIVGDNTEEYYIDKYDPISLTLEVTNQWHADKRAKFGINQLATTVQINALLSMYGATTQFEAEEEELWH
jgi:hypothetical protein